MAARIGEKPRMCRQPKRCDRAVNPAFIPLKHRRSGIAAALIA